MMIPGLCILAIILLSIKALRLSLDRHPYDPLAGMLSVILENFHI
jgi:hypothetical protein